MPIVAAIVVWLVVVAVFVLMSGLLASQIQSHDLAVMVRFGGGCVGGVVGVMAATIAYVEISDGR